MDNEKLLVAQLRTGDEAAFRQFFDRYKNRVFNTILGLVASRSDAEDLTQEVFVEVYLSIENFRETARLSTWIYRIAVNKALNFQRFRRAKKRFGGLISIFTGGAVEEKSDFIHPGLLLENKEQAARISQAIEQLPEKQKTAFVLRQMEDLSYQEIGEVMQTSVPSVESLLFRAKQNLQKWLK